MEINDIQQKIVSEIHKLHGRKNFVGENIMVCCPFHNDSNPSAGVFVGVGMDIPLGFFSCMGCGAKGHWNTWAPKAGLESVPEWQLRAATELSIGGVSKIVDDVGRTKRFKRVRDLMVAVARKAYIEWPEQTDWRGYNGKLLHDFGALLNMPAGADLPVCFLPCNVRGNYVGGVAGYLEKVEGRTSYLTTRGPWVKECGVLGYHLAKRLIREYDIPYVAIGEGPRDMLRMLCEGIPCVAGLGANTWTSEKTKIIESLGVGYCFGVTDNDKGGRLMRKGLRREFMNSIVDLKFYRLPEEYDKKGKLIKMDPDNAEQDVIDDFKHYLYDRWGKRALYNPRKLGWERKGGA